MEIGDIDSSILQDFTAKIEEIKKLQKFEGVCSNNMSLGDVTQSSHYWENKSNEWGRLKKLALMLIVSNYDEEDHFKFQGSIIKNANEEILKKLGLKRDEDSWIRVRDPETKTVAKIIAHEKLSILRYEKAREHEESFCLYCDTKIGLNADQCGGCDTSVSEMKERRKEVRTGPREAPRPVKVKDPEPDIDQWACASCTLYNSQADKICSACGIPRTPCPEMSRQPEPAGLASWKCQNCEYPKNEGLNCEICKEPRDKTAPQRPSCQNSIAREETRDVAKPRIPPEPQQAWMCSSCTMKNDAGAANCTVCLEPKP